MRKIASRLFKNSQSLKDRKTLEQIASPRFKNRGSQWLVFLTNCHCEEWNDEAIFYKRTKMHFGNCWHNQKRLLRFARNDCFN